MYGTPAGYSLKLTRDGAQLAAAGNVRSKEDDPGSFAAANSVEQCGWRYQAAVRVDDSLSGELRW